MVKELTKKQEVDEMTQWLKENNYKRWNIYNKADKSFFFTETLRHISFNPGAIKNINKAFRRAKELGEENSM